MGWIDNPKAERGRGAQARFSASAPRGFGGGAMSGAEREARTAMTVTFMNHVFGWMAAALGVSGVIAYGVMSIPGAFEAVAPLMLPLVIAELVVVMVLSARLEKISTTAALAGFMAYAALNGLTIGVIVSLYTAASVAQIFGLTAFSFAGLATFGMVTKRDLSPIGNFLIMGVWALLGAMVLNIFIGSSALDFAVSPVGVLVFAGLTAYDTNKLKQLAWQGFSSQHQQSAWAIRGALSLYLDFINLFLFLLRLFGDRR
jgi:FtsH-binding integral membrane protein